MKGRYFMFQFKKFAFLILVFCFSLSINAQSIVSSVNEKYSSQICSNESVLPDDKQDTSQIEVNCIFSIGNACRPCYYLKKYNLRVQSAPLDWMMQYSLNTVIHLLETQFVDFFEEIEVMPNKHCGNNLYVKDIKNNIISIHHFRKDADLQESRVAFRDKMLDRAKKTNEILNKSSSIGLICNRKNATKEELIDFAIKFSEIYPDKKISLVNVVDSDIKSVEKETLFENENLKIIQFSFKDYPPSDDKEKHPVWQGNYNAWDLVIKSFKVSDINSGNTSSVESLN